MLGCQVSANAPLCWDEGMGHLCLVSKLGSASTWEAPCLVWGSEGASGMERVWGCGCVCTILGEPRGSVGISGKWEF